MKLIDPDLQDRDRNKIEACKLQISADTTLVNTPIQPYASGDM